MVFGSNDMVNYIGHISDIRGEWQAIMFVCLNIPSFPDVLSFPNALRRLTYGI